MAKYYNCDKDGISSLKVIIPEGLKREVLELGHDNVRAGHMGCKKTIQKVIRTLYWPNVCKELALCAPNIKRLPQARYRLQMYLAAQPLQRVHIDFFRTIAYEKLGNIVTLVLIDQFIKWVKFYPLPNQCTEIVTKKHTRKPHHSVHSPTKGGISSLLYFQKHVCCSK